MKKAVLLASILAAALAACSPQIHLDLLGEEKLQEVVLLPSAGPGEGPDDRHRRDDLVGARHGISRPGEERRRPRLRAPRTGRRGPLGQGGHPQDRHAGRRGHGERHHLPRGPPLQGADGPARRRTDDERRRVGRLLHRLGLRLHHGPSLDADREHRRHLHLPQRRVADGQGRGQGQRHQVRPVQGLGLAVPGHDRRGEKALPGDHRRILRGLPRGRGPEPEGQDAGGGAPDDRRRPRLYGPAGPRSSASSTPSATSTTPSARPSPSPRSRAPSSCPTPISRRRRRTSTPAGSATSLPSTRRSSNRCWRSSKRASIISGCPRRRDGLPSRAE